MSYDANVNRLIQAALAAVSKTGGDRMKWTKDRPTEPGWYWYQHFYTGEPMITWVYYEILLSGDGRPQRLVTNGGHSLNEVSNGKWAGPIPEPDE